jgi:hypothetical protein
MCVARSSPWYVNELEKLSPDEIISCCNIHNASVYVMLPFQTDLFLEVDGHYVKTLDFLYTVQVQIFFG